MSYSRATNYLGEGLAIWCNKMRIDCFQLACHHYAMKTFISHCLKIAYLTNTNSLLAVTTSNDNFSSHIGLNSLSLTALVRLSRIWPFGQIISIWTYGSTAWPGLESLGRGNCWPEITCTSSLMRQAFDSYGVGWWAWGGWDEARRHVGFKMYPCW